MYKTVNFQWVIKLFFQDAQNYYNQLPNKLGLHYIDHSFIHGDFIIGINATELIYNKIIRIIE